MIKRQINRVTPAAPVGAFKTYGMHIVEREPTSCEQFGCDGWRAGWVTTVLPGSDDMLTLLAACRGEIDGHKRHYVMLTLPDGFVRFTFEAGQPCFRASSHSIPVTARYSLRDGDWRGNPSGRRVVTDNARTWLDDFGEHQQRIVEQRQRYGAE